MRYLVTGGAGFVGSHVVLELFERGDELVVLDNLRQGHRAAIPPGVKLIEADLADADAVDAVLAAGPWDGVLHFAALSLVGESMRLPFPKGKSQVALKTNRRGTLESLGPRCAAML